MSITELSKPMGTWCELCQVGKGCRIYDSRPRECATFNCGFLDWDQCDEKWWPAKSKIVLVAGLDGSVVARVDPSGPNAWREEPYYSDLKRWAVAAARRQVQLLACIGDRTIVILPDRDVDLGVVADDEIVAISERSTSTGIQLDAVKIKKTDPLADKL